MKIITVDFSQKRKSFKCLICNYEKIKHPHGNIKFFLKIYKNSIEKLTRFLVNFICKLDDNDEIIISSATHAPWKKDKNFAAFYKNIKPYTLLDPARSYTLWQCSKNLKTLRVKF